ncbi:MAG: prephenate dehydrogenase/arogenate dehydrogenase family protein [Polyangia bacterium]
MDSKAPFSRLALIGVGYIGSSAVLAARRAGLVGSATGYDVDAKAGPLALARGVVDQMADSAESAVAGASLVLLAAPVLSLAGLLRRIAGQLAPTATVIDVGSVKQSIVLEADAALPGGRFVGCHPMAGAEHVGVGAADPEIFAGRVCFLCPSARTSAEATRAATSFWQSLGCQVASIEPSLHDHLMAAVSHLPHVAAFALAASLSDSLPLIESNALLGRPTTSLRDTIRVAGSSPQVWRDILLANREHLLPLVRELEQRVGTIGAAMAGGDAAALEAALALGQACRQRLVK